MRKLMFTLHKYTGLILGLLLSITGISGSIIVFDHAIDEMITPKTVAFDPADGQAPLSEVLDSASAAVSGDEPATRIYLARREGSPHMVRFPTPPDRAGPVEVTVNPVNAEVLAVRHWGEYPVSWMYYLHYGFLAGEFGHQLVGVVGLLMLFFCISGVVIWWPGTVRGKRQWRRAFTVRKDKGAYRLNYDLHKTAGVYLLPVYIVLSISGISLIWHDPFDNLVDAIIPLDTYPAPRSTGNGTPVSIDEVARIGQAEFPQASLKRIYLPAGEDGTWRVALNQRAEPWSSHAGTTVWVDQYSGEVLDHWDPTTIGAGSTFLEWQFPLHNGDAFGLVGRWVVFIAGLIPAGLFGTGLYMWWRKRHPRRY